MPAIEVSHVTKEFRLGALQGLKQTVLNMGARLAGKPVPEAPLFKALDDVSFTIERGEVVGIIGHNGAGKSTLLKMLAQISAPTRGSVRVDGRVAPLIEVGAGFVPDFTGRENVYLNGSILGMSRAEINRKFDEIVGFAEMAEFIDTPVKRYSSGMQVKLAFAVATSVESEILIVDEVLAVGDVAFQRKCLTRMQSLIREQGRTVLIVGHNIRQLERLCTRMMLLKKGKLILDGSPGEISKRFLDESTIGRLDGIGRQSSRVTSTDSELRIEAIEILTDHQQNDLPVCPVFGDLRIRIKFEARSSIKNAEINIGLHNPEMIFAIKSSTSLSKAPVDIHEGMNVVDIVVEKLSLCPGVYGLGVGIYDWARRPLWSGDSLGWIMIEATPEIAPCLPVGTLSYTSMNWRFATPTTTDPT